MLARGTFREDLYYRINVVKLELPPLSERREDIPLLVDHFINQFNIKKGKKVIGIPNHVLSMFMEYDWPGNVRELKNIVERTLMLGEVPRGSLGTRRPAERMAVPEYPIDWIRPSSGRRWLASCSTDVRPHTDTTRGRPSVSSRGSSWTSTDHDRSSFDPNTRTRSPCA